MPSMEPIRPFPRSRGRRAAAAACAAFLAPACGGDASPGPAGAPAPPIRIEMLASPAPPGSAEPDLALAPDGFILSWLEETGPGRHALRFARLGPDGWSAPGTVMEREDLFVNWADFPSLLVLDDGTLAAHWLEKSGPGTYAYDVRMATSGDGGRSWSEDIIPHRDGLEAEHGFVSLFPLQAEPGGARVGAVWLDGRETVEGRPMTLRFAAIGPDGPSGGTLLDPDVCDCCQTSAAVSEDGPVVAYRDRTGGEVRDIRVVRRVAGEWTEPRTVHDDGWVIDACPVNGPAIAAAGSRVAAAWFTGAPGPRVLVAFSDDAGATFGPPVRVDEGAGQGRVDVVLLDDGAALVSWLERSEGAAEIRVRRVTPSGADPAFSLAGTSAERASGFPRMARNGDRILFAWTEAGTPSRVRTALGRVGTAGAAGGAGAGPEASEVAAGSFAPRLAAVTLEGDSVALADLRGSAVLLNVWATWCAPCRREIPELQALHEQYGPRGLRVIGVTVDARSAGPDIRAFADEFGMTYDLWWDPDQTVVSAFEAAGVPLTVLIGPDGRIRWRHLGAVLPGDPGLREALEALL